jgi:hypothetical protein
MSFDFKGLREKHIDNRVLMRIFGHKKDELTGGWRSSIIYTIRHVIRVTR